MSIFRVLDRSIGGELGSSKNYDLQRHMTRHILLNHKVILIISFFNDNNKNDQIVIILILLTHVKYLKGIVVNLTEIPFYILLTSCPSTTTTHLCRLNILRCSLPYNS